MRHYETIFIVHPNLNEEEYKGVVKKFTTLAEKVKAVIVKVEEWGLQRLAYRVKKCDKGYYVLIDYCADPGATMELERDMKLDDRVLKFQSVKLADEADPNELILKENEKKKKGEPVEGEAPPPEPQASASGAEGESVKEEKSDV